MLPKHKDLTGKIFCRLKALHRIGTKHDCALWLCRCYCGNICEVTVAQLNRKHKPQNTCGHCYDHIKYPAEWLSWRNMMLRCYSKTNKDYHNYGGRGIIVCDRWRNSFLFFLEDMRFKLSREFTLERREVNGNYEPSNCIWSHKLFQNMNKRNTYKFLQFTEKDFK